MLSPYGMKPLGNTFDKVDRFIRNSDWTKYLTLSSSEKYINIFNRILITSVLNKNQDHYYSSVFRNVY